MHNYLLYYIIILPFSILPMFMLHGISWFTSLMMYNVFGYRKKVVLKNIRNSFPEKSEKEVKKLAKQYYNHLCDLIVESIKMFSIREKKIQKRMKCRNPEVVNKWFEQGRNVILVGGHYNNWEMYALAAPMHLAEEPYAIFKPMSNKFWNKRITGSRSRTGIKMIPPAEVAPLFRSERKEPFAIIFASDQAPGSSKKAYWTDFLNQDTAVAYGAEKYAREFDAVVVTGMIYKTKRSHYEIEYTDLTAESAATEYGDISEELTRRIEKVIIEKPEFWLWSHKRWKRKRPTNDE